jgi:hypothetical protein
MDKNKMVAVKDKSLAPFLLACSFANLVKFEGKSMDSKTLYWFFSPSNIVNKLTEQFSSKTEPHIHAKDIFEAQDVWLDDIRSIRKI